MIVPGFFARRIILTLGLGFVLFGMVNATPAIPGWDSMWQRLTANPSFALRAFPVQFLYPLAFFWMMLILVVAQSAWRDWSDRSQGWRIFGLSLDIALILAAAALCVTYLIEIQSVCLIDQLTGVRTQIMVEALTKEIAYAETYGLPTPTSVEDPNCVKTTGVWLVPIVGISVMVFLLYNVRVWGLSLAMISLLMALYAIATVVVWYYFGTHDINKYFVTKLGGEPRLLSDGRPKILDALVNQGSGLLGQFIAILMNTVFPYIVLGTLLGGSAGGRTLIKLAVLLTRRLRGGPAHAAIISSALFGTTNGAPVINVLSTGTLTIPMMVKNGFSRVYAGGVEAAASSGGQIMPPVMGVAAFMLAAMAGVPYREVIIAATIPAIAYFACMFLSVLFQARKQNIQAIGDNIGEEMRLNGTDRIHALQIFLPILLITVLLLLSKDSIGCDPISLLLGAQTTIAPNGTCLVQRLPWVMQLIQNAAGDAGSVGWWAAVLMLVLLFLDADMRAAPLTVFRMLASAGEVMAGLYLMFFAVSVIDVSLNFTGLAGFVALDIVDLLKGMDIGGGAPLVLNFVALLLTMLLAMLLGMGMPAVPAYINAALLMGPLLVGLGISAFTAHFFIFYFACASAITPPVAVASFAAASVSRANPMATGFSAVRSGAMLFVIPFVFAFNPELLLIEAAVLNQGPGAIYLPGYDGQIHLPALGWLLCRLALALYLLASALARYDRAPLGKLEVLMRLVASALVFSSNPYLQSLALVLAAASLGWHFIVGHMRSTSA